MERGYVAAGTDTGHVDAGFEWAIGHPEKWADWGYRAVHEMVVVTKTTRREILRQTYSIFLLEQLP